MTRTAATPRELRTRLAELSIRDDHRLRRRLDKARGGDLAELEREIEAAERRIAARRAAVPPISYPEQLPVSARREDIAAAIAANQVVVIAGETGSGKTTQIPKICLELGRGIRGAIGHTQPRRLAARTVAERIAEELHTELGDVVGYTVRFTDHASERTLIKLMTDGILLAEIQRDRMLRRYDTIIIDEAHERSLNIDFLLGYLKQLLPRRPDLKVIITSATIDPELFARHFADSSGHSDTPAPIVEVSGRSFPVEVRYRPLSLEVPVARDDLEDPADEDTEVVDRDPTDAIGDAVRELQAEGDGDILVFLSGEREIRDTADSLRDMRLPRTEILPLYARLSAAEQHRVFEPHTGRRVVLATNVAETSLTVPGIRYVIDPGTARISRYSLRTKVQRLPIESISQASARQRSGRCGRVADGIAIRLYSEDDFEARPQFTEPEILRTNLAAVILQMTALGLGDIEGFPFVEPPDSRAIRDGIALLEELGALSRSEPGSRTESSGQAEPDRRGVVGSPTASDSQPTPNLQPDGRAKPGKLTAADTQASSSDTRATSDKRAAAGEQTGSDGPLTPDQQALDRQAEPSTPDSQTSSEARAESNERAAASSSAESGGRTGKRSHTPGGLTLTAIGREMAQIPVDPRMARMLAEAQRGGCLADVLVVVAALSIQDVRERPVEHQQAADAKHARFAVEGSDFLSYLRLWDYLREQRNALSSNQFRRMCRDEFLHYLRIREWQDLHGQLRTITRGLGWNTTDRADDESDDDTTPPATQGGNPNRRANDAAGDTGSARGRNRSRNGNSGPAAGAARGRSESRRGGGKSEQVATRTVSAAESDSLPWDVMSIHQALLAGMLSHIGLREGETREFLGARNAKFMIFPGSGLAKKPPRWVMAAELVETSRLWGRTAARIEPEWAERLAGDLVKRTYSEPHWSAKRGSAAAYERVTLYGIPLATQRRVDLGRIDPELSRELFIRHALVQGEWQTQHEFFARNRELLEDVADLEHRARRRDILVDDEVLFDFYDRRIPADIVSVRHFDNWWRKTRRADPELLNFTASTVVNEQAAVLDPTAYPDSWRQGELTFPLTYQFEPGQADDGVTAHIPIAQLAHVRAVGFDWLVPGMREELAAALIKTLPKHVRRSVVPAPDFARAALVRLTPRGEPLRIGLARELSQLGSVTIRPADLDAAALPDHLRMTFAATAPDGTIAARGKDLAALKTRLADQVSKSVARATAAAERAPATVWTSESLGALTPTVRRQVGGQTITGYPALVVETGPADGKGTVAVRVLSSPAAQAAAMRTGTRTLLLNQLTTSARTATAGLSPTDRLALSQNPSGSLDALIEDCRACAADELIAEQGGPVRTPDEFTALIERVRPRFGPAVSRIVRLVVPILAQAHRVRAELANTTDREIADDVRHQLDDLVFAGFATEFGSARLRELPRYLQAAVVRLEALPASAPRDHQGMLELDRVHAAYQRLLDALPESRRTGRDVTEIWWMIEEFRVSLFAQQLGTPHPVSAKRIERAITTLRTTPTR
ncbi:ATP-dependent RNA helicase HrpA [Nocardia alni]|uniref:ATP-dependent RNA helicase HrpA n=1 Tax=Nocardia alni TaxID=2815723 RepID=UPI0020B3D300|nr:ATP-dependent RNA helicase HrpA [Nocardia alni]